MPRFSDVTLNRERLLTIALLSTSIIGTFIILHVAFDPNFFLKDDTISYFLPQIKVQGETLFTFKQIPQINLYQLLGHPLLEQGQCGVFYPLHYICYLAAGHNIERVVPLEVGCHILIAGLGMLALLRHLGVSEFLCFVGAYAYAFNGFLIDIGRNWMPVSGYMAWIPIIFLCAIRCAQTNEGWLKLILANVVLFTLGHTDLYVRIVVAETLLFLALAGSLRAVCRYLLAHSAAAVLVLPILLPMVGGFMLSSRFANAGSFDMSRRASSAVRALLILQNTAYVSVRASSALRAILIPPKSLSIFAAQSNTLPLFSVMPLAAVLLLGVVVAGKLPQFSRNDASTTAFQGLRWPVLPQALQLTRRQFTLIVIGTLLLALPGMMRLAGRSTADLVSSLIIHMALMLGAYWTLRRGRRSADSPILWGTLTLVAISLALGPVSLTTYLFYPFVVFFRWPVKWYLIVQPFLTITCALALSRLNWQWSAHIAVPMTIVLIAISIWINGTHAADFNGGFIPISRTQNYRTAEMISGRVVGLGEGGSGGSTRLFADNIGSYYDVLSFSGYDPMISAEKLSRIRLSHVSIIRDPGYYQANRAFLNAYGVQTYLGAHAEKYDFLKSPEFERVGSVEDVQIYRNREADPVAFIASSKQSLPYRIAGNSVIVTLDDAVEPREVVIGFLFDKGWNARADGHAIGLTSDRNNRIVARVEPHTQSLKLTYGDPLFRDGIGLSVALGLIFLGGYYAATRRTSVQMRA